jgi:hypothetical protein
LGSDGLPTISQEILAASVHSNSAASYSLFYSHAVNRSRDGMLIRTIKSLRKQKFDLMFLDVQFATEIYSGPTRTDTGENRADRSEIGGRSEVSPNMPNRRLESRNYEMWKVKSTRYEASDSFRQDEAKIEERQIVESADLFDLLHICRTQTLSYIEHDDRTADVA